MADIVATDSAPSAAAAAPSRLPQTPEEFRRWLKELRGRSGLSHDNLAAAVGVTRQQTIRWEKYGEQPRALAFLKLLSALGVQIDPAPPEELPAAVNAELAALRREVRLLRSEVSAVIGGVVSDGQ